MLLLLRLLWLNLIRIPVLHSIGAKGKVLVVVNDMFQNTAIWLTV